MGHINNRVYVSSPFFFIHPPKISFQFHDFPLPTCVSSHGKKKKRKEISARIISSLSSNVYRFVSIQAQRLILTQTLKLHCPTRSLSQRGTTVLSACLSVSINSPQAAMLHTRRALSTYVQILRVDPSAKCTVIAF